VIGAPHRRYGALAFVLFLLLPAALLGECLFGGKTFQPYDIAEFPPISTTLTREQQQELRATANYDATEAPIWFAIELRLAREALTHGQLPHWNGYVRGGAPLLAHGHLGLLDPLHWPALLFPDPSDGLLCLSYIMFALAGALMYGFLRALRIGHLAAIFGGVAFTWSGTLSANAHWFMRMEPLALMPGMLWAMLAIARRSGHARAKPTIGLALAMACTWLSGFPQYGIPTTLIAAAFGLLLCLHELRHGLRPSVHLAGWMAVGGGLGLLLAMPSLLQMLHFYPLSNRPIDETLDRASRHAWAPMGFLGYLFPDVFSHPGDSTMPQDSSPLPWLWSNLHHWETGEQLLPNYNFTEYAIFPGTLPLVFAVLALLQKGPKWRLLPAIGLCLVWLMATGAFGFFAAYLLPGIKTVPPYRFAGPASAFVAMLAAIGFDSLRSHSRPGVLRLLAVVLAAVGSFCLAESTRVVPPTDTSNDPWLSRIVERYREPYAREHGVRPSDVTPTAAHHLQFSATNPTDAGNPYDTIRLGRERLHWNLRRGGFALLFGAGFLFLLSLRGRGRSLVGWPAILAIGFTAVELGDYGFHLNRGQAMPYPHTSAVHDFLRAQRDAEKAHGGFLVSRGYPLDNGTPASSAFDLPGGTLAAEHIRDLNFYTFVDNKSDLPIRKLYGDAQILRGFVCGGLPDDERLELPWWDLMGLRYVLSTHAMQHAGARVGPELKGPLGEFFVYERPHAMPRAWFVPKLRVIDKEKELVDALVAKDFDPRAAALVSSADATLLGPLPADAKTRDRTVEFVLEDKKHLVLRLGGGAPGYLVLADTFFPGWEATIDEETVPIARGNLYQRVVAVPAKGCALHFRFRADGFRMGLGLGACGLLGLFALLLLGRHRPPRSTARNAAGGAADDDTKAAEPAAN
jgi:hypothetical protein